MWPSAFLSWERCRFEDLLRRAEEQLLTHRKSGMRKKRDAQPDPPARADHARQTAAVGAARKATTGLVSSMLSFEEEEDLTWPGRTGLQRPGAGTSSRLPWVRTGIRPSPVCTTPPSQPQAPLALERNTLSALFCRISAGTLPPAARWLTRTRLCWLAA